MILKFQENITEIPKKYRHMVKDFYKTPTGTWMIDLVDGYTTSYGTNYIENKYKKDCLYELMNEVSADEVSLNIDESKNIKPTNKEKKEEASRNELLALAKMQTKTRYEKAAGYKGFSIVDIDTSMLLRDDTITVTCNVGKYYDTIQLMDVLIWIQMESERNPNNQVNTKAITAALMEAIDALEIKVNCTCADWQYRFAYQATQLDYKYGKPENRPADITNPHNYGSMCFTGDTLVLTDKGLKPIKDIEIGDNVFTHKGRLRPVLDKSNHFEDKLLEAKIGTEVIKCTENHPFYIYNNKDFEWNNLKEVKWNKNYCCSPKLNLDESKDLPKGYAFLLGLYLSDGHIDSRRQPNGSLYQNQLTIALDETYKQIYEDKIKELGFKYRFKESKYGYDTKCINLQIYDRKLIKFLIEYGGFTYKKEYTKFLNEKCLNWSNQDKLDLINGFFWGDGQFGVTGNKEGYLQYILYNSNKDIMQKLYILIRSFTYARIFSMTKKPFWSKTMNKLITPCEHYLICLRGEHIKDIIQDDSYLVKSSNSYKHPISSYTKNKIDSGEIQYYLTNINKKDIKQTEGEQVYNLKVAEDESYLITRELYAVHNCKHLISMLSNKKWLQQVTGTIMDWVVKNIDKVNEYLRPKEGMELTLPNELARQNAKLGFYSKLFKDKLEDEPEEEVEDNVDNNNDTDNSNDNNDNVEDNKDNNQNNSNNTNSDNGDDLDDSNINSDEETN